MIRTYARRALILSLALFSSPQEGFADADSETETPYVLPELVVTPTRHEADPWLIPAATDRIPLRDGGPATLARNVPEALRETRSVMIQKTGHGMASPYLRGFTGFRTLALVDGIRLNHAAFRDGPNPYWGTLDPESLDQLEVVLGPASVLYGSDAIGGAVNAIPTGPPEWSGIAEWGGRTRYRFSSAEHLHGGRAEAYARPSAGVGVFGGVTWKDFGDLRGGRSVGRQPRTGYEDKAADFRLHWDFSSQARMVLAHQSTRQDDVWRTHRTIYGTTWKGLSHGDDLAFVFDRERDLTYARLLGTDENGWDYRVTAYHQAHVEDQYRVRSDGRRDRQGFDITTWGMDAQAAIPFPAGRWTFGINADRDSTDTYADTYAATTGNWRPAGPGPVADGATYERLGLYLQNELPAVGRSWPEITTGLRYTYARARADRVWDPIAGDAFRLDTSWSDWVGSIRGLYSWGARDRFVVYTGVSQGFRAPNLSDLTRFSIARANELETPVTDLDPERYLSFDAGLRLDYSPVRLEVEAYHTHIDGMIVRTPTGHVTPDGLIEVTKRNAGDGYVQGIEGTLDISLSHAWTAWARVSWMNGRVDGYPDSAAEPTCEPISRLMPLTGRIGLRWAPPNGRFWVEAVGEAADRADRLSAGDRRDTQRIPNGGTPAYAVCHMRAGGALASTLRLTVALENILDADYRIHGSGLNEPGRNLVLAVEMDW